MRGRDVGLGGGVSEHSPLPGQLSEVVGGAARGARAEGVREVDAEETGVSGVAVFPLEAVEQGPVGEAQHVHRVQAYGCT